MPEVGKRYEIGIKYIKPFIATLQSVAPNPDDGISVYRFSRDDNSEIYPVLTRDNSVYWAKLQDGSRVSVEVSEIQGQGTGKAPVVL